MLIFNIIIVIVLIYLLYKAYDFHQANKIRSEIFKKMITIIDDIDSRLKELEKINQDKK